PILDESNRDKARAALTAIQRRWDEIGRVPREKVKSVEERMRKIEAAVRKLDDEHWERNNPERKARVEGLASQLAEAIAKLERELEAAKAGGNEKKIREAQEALDARRQWLGVIDS